MLLLPATGCDQPTAAQSDFAAGAFPPTLSDMDYHQRSWTRTDCLVCHETGVDQAPAMKHNSLPPLVKEGKCRTCHVFIEGSKPGE